MSEPLEVRLDDGILSFDGRVIEEFGFGNQHTERRIHVSLAEKVDFEVLGKRAFLEIKGRGGGRIIVGGKLDQDQVAELEAFVAAIRSARGEPG
jgi:hypothetical protein